MQCSLPNSLAAWESPRFSEIFCEEVAALPASVLRLEKALLRGSHVLPEPPQVMLLNAAGDERTLQLRAGIFFASVLAGCNCADDPGPMDEYQEYCQVTFLLDRVTAVADFAVSPM